MTDSTDPPPQKPRQEGAANWQRMLWILAAAQLFSSVGFSMIFPFLPNYVEALGSSTGTSLTILAGAVFSAQAITMAISAPLWGGLADRFGRKPMLVRALLGGAVILGLMGFVQSAEQLILLRAIQGVITGTVSAGNALVASIAPRDRTGYAMSVLQTASWAGVAVGPLLGGMMADRFGYASSFVITAALLLVGGLAVVFGVKEDFRPQVGKAAGNFLLRGRQVIATAGVKTVFVIRFAASLAKGLLVPILPLFIPILLQGQTGVSTFTGLVIGVSSATGTMAAVWLGNLGDRIGHKRIFIWSSAFAALSLLPMAFATEGWHMLVLNALSGIATGGLLPSLSALIVQYVRDEDVGSAFGLDNSVMSAARALAPLVAVGAAQFWGYQSVFVIGAAILVGTLFYAVRALPEPAPRQRSKPA